MAVIAVRVNAARKISWRLIGGIWRKRLPTVRKVLDTEHAYLTELGACETVDKGKESDRTQSGIHLQEDSTESEDESNEE